MKNQIVQLNQQASPSPAKTPSKSSTALPCTECVVYQQTIAKLTQQLQDVTEKYESARDGGNNNLHPYLLILFFTPIITSPPLTHI